MVLSQQIPVNPIDRVIPFSAANVAIWARGVLNGLNLDPPIDMAWWGVRAHRHMRMPPCCNRIGVLHVSNRSHSKGISLMKLSHTLTRTSGVFDDPNLVSSAGLVPLMGPGRRSRPA